MNEILRKCDKCSVLVPTMMPLHITTADGRYLYLALNESLDKWLIVMHTSEGDKEFPNDIAEIFDWWVLLGDSFEERPKRIATGLNRMNQAIVEMEQIFPDNRYVRESVEKYRYLVNEATRLALQFTLELMEEKNKTKEDKKEV